MNKMITEELFNAFKNGDSDVFNEIVLRFYPKTRSFIRHIVHSEQDAEEIVQDVFVKLWQNCSKINNRQGFSSYLYRIATNECMNFLKKIKAERVMFSEKLLEEGSNQGLNGTLDHNIEDKLDAVELELKVRLVIDSMPQQRREVIILSRFEGLDNQTIAKKLEINTRVVENHIYRALIQLKNAILFIIMLLKYT